MSSHIAPSATGIPEERCNRINLGYRETRGMTAESWQREAGPGDLVVPRAGEMLYRVGQPPAGDEEQAH